MKIFISYTSSDKEWAQWIGWELQEAGHEPFIHDWEIGAGENIAGWMEQRFKQADRLIGVFSNLYCEAAFSQSERWAAYWKDPRGRDGFFVPIEVRRVSEWPAMVDSLKRLSLVDLDESEASRRLVAFLQPAQIPTEKPTFPGNSPPLPASVAPFVEGSEPLGLSPPSFPTITSIEKELARPTIPITLPPIDLNLRCIDDHEPKPQIFGRDNEVETIVGALLEGKVVLIAGGPGMGKTAVATVALYEPRVVAHFGRQRVFASLEAATEPRAILAKLVEMLGLPSTGDEVSLLRIIEANAAENSFAAVLDNAETVFDLNRSEAERLLNLVARIDGLSLVVTIRGVPPPIPGALQIDDLTKLDLDAARGAFLAVAGESFTSDKNLPHLLEALDGHALSIRLVAAQAIGSPSLRGLRESWDEVHAEILRMSGEEESRLTSVRASLALSLNSRRIRSTPLARRLLTLLAFLPGGLSEEDVRPLLGSRGSVTKTKANESVICLHQLRLVERRPDRRLRMLTPLRECTKSDVLIFKDDRTRIIRHYLKISTHAYTIGSRNWKKFRHEVESEADNLDSICELAVTTSISDHCLPDALQGLAEFHSYSGRGDIGSVRSAVARLRLRPPSKFLARCIMSLGGVARLRSHNEAARELYQESLTLTKKVGDLDGEADSNWNLGEIARVQSDNNSARAYTEKALLLFRRAGSVAGQAGSIKVLGDMDHMSGKPGAALSSYQRALALYREIGEAGGEARIIHALGDVARSLSDHFQARAHYEEALAINQHIGDVIGAANCIKGIACVALDERKEDEARARFEESLLLYRRIGDLLGEANCVKNLGTLARLHSDFETARMHLDEAAARYKSMSVISGEADCATSLGDLHLADGDRTTATECYEKALLLYRRAGSFGGEAELMIRLGLMEHMTTKIEAGFALYFEIADVLDLALPGWRAMHSALTCNSAIDAQTHRELAKSLWTAIGRLDLVFDWVDRI